jgi:hypothetical protein
MQQQALWHTYKDVLLQLAKCLTSTRTNPIHTHTTMMAVIDKCAGCCFDERYQTIVQAHVTVLIIQQGSDSAVCASFGHDKARTHTQAENS